MKKKENTKRQYTFANSIPPHILKYLPPSITGRGRGWVLEDVALELSRRTDLDASFVLRQIEGWQRLRTKVPRWAEVEGIHFPPRLALEQCSGQPAAEYKAKVVQRLLASSPPPVCRGSLPIGFLPLDNEGSTRGVGGGRGLGSWRWADLTGGMGVDFSFIAPLFDHATYVEQREELVEAARHNFPLLGLGNAEIIHGDGVEYLRTMEPVDLIFLDPARRDAHGGKTVFIEDCEPNVKELLPLLRSKGRFVMVKLSTMLDLHQTIATLPGISEVHVFAAGGECKDLLLVFGSTKPSNPATVPCNSATAPSNSATKPGYSATVPEASASGLVTEPAIFCADEHSTFTFTASQEATATCQWAETIEGYLYEPNPAIMKAGAYKTVALHYGVEKLHPNSHLYRSDRVTSDFPGRAFSIERTYTFSKADIKALTNDLKAEGGKANLTVRNFPASVADLRKKLKIKEGGNTYLFATTDRNERKIIVRCKKIN